MTSEYMTYHVTALESVNPFTSDTTLVCTNGDHETTYGMDGVIIIIS